jgi:hypothetical protein
MFGDFIHNLRAALDHFVYAAAITQTKTNPPADERILQFPIADTPVCFARQAGGIKSLSEEVRTSVERVQPYNKGHQALPPLLGLLRDFDNSDKHRLLKITSSWQYKGAAQIKVPDGHLLKSISSFPDEIQNRADILAFTVEPPSVELKYKYQASFAVGISHNPGPTGVDTTAVKTLLELLSAEVRTVIEVVGATV